MISINTVDVTGTNKIISDGPVICFEKINVHLGNCIIQEIDQHDHLDVDISKLAIFC